MCRAASFDYVSFPLTLALSPGRGNGGHVSVNSEVSPSLSAYFAYSAVFLV